MAHLLLEQVRIGAHHLTSTEYLSHQCTALEEFTAFDTSRTVNMAGLFSGARRLRQIPQLDTSRATQMQNMFQNRGSLKSLPLFDTGDVPDMSGMFQSAFLLTTVSKFDTSRVETMAGMFDAAWMLQNLPLLDTSNVKSMRQMFLSAWGLLIVPELDVAKVTDFTGTFGEAGGQSRQVTKIGMKGISNAINLSDKNLSAHELNRIIARISRRSMTRCYPSAATTGSPVATCHTSVQAKRLRNSSRSQ